MEKIKEKYISARQQYIFALMEALNLPDEPWVYNHIRSKMFYDAKSFCKTDKQKGALNVLEGRFIDW
jgi:hypothetical protein